MKRDWGGERGQEERECESREGFFWCVFNLMKNLENYDNWYFLGGFIVDDDFELDLED